MSYNEDDIDFGDDDFGAEIEEFGDVIGGEGVDVEADADASPDLETYQRGGGEGEDSDGGEGDEEDGEVGEVDEGDEEFDPDEEEQGKPEPAPITVGRATTRFLTKYEKPGVIGYRAKQIEEGAPIDKSILDIVKAKGISDSSEIAELELKYGKLPFFIIRPIPGREPQIIPVCSLVVLS
jgi:DNA-directed RNA polymerase subunit K/omega